MNFLYLQAAFYLTIELTKCYEPVLKLRMRLCPCKTGLSPSVILCYWSFQGDTSVVVLFVCFFVLVFKNVLCCWHLMYVFIFLVKFR